MRDVMRFVLRVAAVCLFVLLFCNVQAKAFVYCPAGDDTCTGPDNADNEPICQSMNPDDCMASGDPFGTNSSIICHATWGQYATYCYTQTWINCDAAGHCQKSCARASVGIGYCTCVA